MMNPTFLDLLAEKLIARFSDDLPKVTVVLPNKRAKVFLLDALKSKSTHSFFAPQIVSIEDFVQSLSGIRTIDSIELLFVFYDVYLSVTDPKQQQDFDTFSNWAKTLLQDFNEIDRYLLAPEHVFSYLKDIEAIKRWDLEAQSTTVLIDNYLQFWNQMPVYYQALYNTLLQKGAGYQGLVYREAVENLHHFSNVLSDEYYVFAGFNALNQAEERIFQHLLAINRATVYWDVDASFFNDPYHDAGLFSRKIKNNWSYYKSHPYEWIHNEFEDSKNIKVIGTPKAIGQAKIAGDIVCQLNKEHDLNKVAIVLGEENILIPLLHALPASVGSLNITMGFSAKNNPAQLLLHRLFKMHIAALSRKGNGYVFYYKDLLDVLNNPLIEPFVNAKSVVDKVSNLNYTFITHNRLLEFQEHSSPLFLLLFEKWDIEISQILDNLLQVLLLVKQNLSSDQDEEKITKAFVYAVFKVVNKLSNYTQKAPHVTTVETLFEMYKQVIDLAEVSFEGEPLQGLQIMGILESRVLDFETVIVTSMNEGALPAGKSQNSFIPYDVKRELGLPTFKEKDAIYTYHFYHLLQRAKNVYLLYNTESEGIDAGEKSRFITQLEVENKSSHNFTHEIFNAVIPEKAMTPIVIPKSEKLLLRLKEIAETGFSPSSLTSYIRNPIKFYFEKVLRIREAEEVEENIAINTLGTIIHESLKELYTPYLNQFLKFENLDTMLSIYEEEVYKQFKSIYKEGEITKGKNLLAFEVAKRNVFNFLQLEKKLLIDGSIVKVTHLETSFEQLLTDERLPFPVLIKGNIDRIEQRDGKLRIVDYKTGKVEQKNLDISDWNGLTLDIKNEKIIQLLSYALMIPNNFLKSEMEVGVISFKNMKSGFMPFRIKEDKTVITEVVNDEIIGYFLNELIFLINEILNPEIPFVEKMI